MSANPSGPRLHVPGKSLDERLEAAAGRRLAAVMIDLQNDYCMPDGVFAKAGFAVPDIGPLVAAANALTAAARGAGLPVVWVRMIWDEAAGPGLLGERSPFLAAAGLRRGTWGAEPLPGLEVLPDDRIVEKARFGAFHETGLAALLDGEGVEGIVVGGVRTDFCVESTVREAFFRDLDVLVAREAVSGYVESLHENSLIEMGTVFATVCSVEQAVAVLAGRGPGT